jgi:hypothetical protein
MKLKLLVIFLVVISNQSFSQLVNESFESEFTPAGWSEVITSGSNPDWSFVSYTSSPNCTANEGSFMAKFNSFSCASGSKARLYTNALNLSGTGYKLTFYMFHEDGWASANDYIQVQYSVNGASWNQLQNIFRNNGDLGWTKHTIDLSAYDNSPVFYISFVGVSAYGYNMYIDQVQICNNCATSNLSTSLVNIKSLVSPNPATDQITVSIQEAFKTDYTVEICNIQGGILLNQKNSKEITDFNLSIADLAPGNYVLSLYNSSQRGTAKFIKQ